MSIHMLHMLMRLDAEACLNKISGIGRVGMMSEFNCVFPANSLIVITFSTFFSMHVAESSAHICTKLCSLEHHCQPSSVAEGTGSLYA